MDADKTPGTLSRPLAIAFAAIVLLTVTVALGLSLGLLTRAQFREVEASWSDYAGGTEHKGILIREIRGLLGYGGIIHHFKNYVLRQDPFYLEQTRVRLDQFHQIIAEFRGEALSAEEAAALDTIAGTIRKYEAMLPIAVEAAAENWSAADTDALVRVDDRPAILALESLETIWADTQQRSSSRLVRAVGEGQRLIWIGFLSIFALVLAALVLGWLMYLLIRNLREAIHDLARELAERRRLEQSEGRLATAVEQSPATIIITDTDARIQYVNAKFEELTGWSRAEIEGRTPAFLQSGETPDRVYQDIRRRLAAGESWQGVFRNRKKDGANYWSETTILPLVGPDGLVQNFIGIGEDITEKRRAREQVVRAQKLEAVGHLAGGVAHDFNNILTTIIGASHLAALDAEPGSDLASEIEQIDIAARRAQSLVRELLTFARREPGQAKPVDLGEIASEVMRLLRASVPPTVIFDCPDPEREIPVLGDPTHLHQILMNLCRNAAEAMGGNPGTIRVSLAPCDAPEGRDARPDGWVRLDVRDDGPGMSPETLAHLFEPFFTTKPLGKGSGLGLSVVYGLVEEMGGQITVDSAPGKGSCFSVFMPGAPAVPDAEAAQSRELPRGSERLILVDDEAEIAGTFRRVLTRLGYRVEAFTSPLIALERFRGNPDRFDLVISDMVMPDISGEDLIRRFRELRPDIPVIFCSGYKPERIAVPGPAPEMLDKPVDPDRLALTVRQRLDHAGGTGTTDAPSQIVT